MANTAEKPTTKRQTAKKQSTAAKERATMKQGKQPDTHVDEALEEAITLAIKIHWRALKELEKH